MKTSLLLLFLFFLQVEIEHTYKTECINVTAKGRSTMKIWDTKKGKKYKLEQAKIDAVQSILFDGYAGGKCGYLPPLLKHKEDVIEFEEKNLYFFKKSGDYSEYVISSKISEVKPSKMKTKSWVSFDIEVDIKKLDQYLVSEKIKNNIDDNY